MEFQDQGIVSILTKVLVQPMETETSTPTGAPPRVKTKAKPSCRQQTLKFLDSRPALIAVCTLVVIECVCVLVELMVDLQGIRFRFENEEHEIQRFVDYLKKSYPAEFHSFEGRTMEDIIYKLQSKIRLRSENDLYCLPCNCNQNHTISMPGPKDYTLLKDTTKPNGKPVNSSSKSSQSDIVTTKPLTSGILDDGGGGATHFTELQDGNSVIENRTTTGNDTVVPLDLSKVFVLEINNVKESFFLVAEYYPEHVAQDTTKHQHFHSEYEKIHEVSTGIHLGSLAILSIMVIETFIKLFCVGLKFFKKKFEVFDAFIVIASFALDFIFLDSRWYETGKDATTILVLLLPWRVVRIVNSFLMTVNHKHHIEMMTIKRAKKKSEVKNAKLNTLLAEIRKDVQLLVALCKSKDIPEIEISACVYGKGRHNATIAAMSSFASLMLISTLGKNAIYEDEIYGKLFREALADEDEDEDENGNDVKEDTEVDEAIEIDVKPAKKVETKKKKPKKVLWKRSHTVPRRSHSIENIENGNVFYVNDGFLSATAKDDRAASEEARRASFHSKASVRSTPGYTRGSNYVTFEVTTQVTYL
ncbi:uncharacterized protein LOC124141029 isoform X2 [Haliotis rufescens]|uniref:uncharacterized protein LOC124141029 isoform X2 n=1 Tax=Haliotis rufescens TaxID=6454 RepID=UPI001EB044FE|nr:uncharacterized protein LOC124141029 isoform X2 [Haliotis rufescens]